MIIPDNARYFPFFCGAKRGGVSCEVRPYIMRSVSVHDAERVGTRCGVRRYIVRMRSAYGAERVGAWCTPCSFCAAFGLFPARQGPGTVK